MTGDEPSSTSHQHAGDEDLRQIRQWNSIRPAAVESCVHDHVAQTSAKQPDAWAVDAWDGRLTYKQLDDMSIQVARQIVQLTAHDSSDVVPIYCAKSKWTAVAILAVMRSGHAAVLLDSTSPHVRLEAIAAQVSPSLIVSTHDANKAATLRRECQVLHLDEALLERPNASSPLPTVEPAALAYITYTSGTTGRPKGACITHISAMSAVFHQGGRLGFHEQSRVLDFVPYSFDVAWANFIQTICAGGCLCVPRPTDSMQDLGKALAAFRCTLLNATPTVLRTLSLAPDCLQTILLSGEVPFRENVVQWADRVRLINTYGSAESFKSTFSEPLQSAEQRPNIGRGVGTRTWVVDPADPIKLMAIGAVGELYVEGPHIAEGYYHDAKNTSFAFVEDPKWLTGVEVGPKVTVYRTGDLVRYEPDGALMFVGRYDSSQLNIRGQRVEIGDVEHNVRSCLSESIHVIADQILPRESQTPSLALFVQTYGHQIAHLRTALQDLQTKLVDVLPAYMIPSVYIPVDRIESAAIGKTDRKRLREMANAMRFQQLLQLQSTILPVAAYVAPTSIAERKLARIWASVLSCDAESISADDNFFGIGGNSILAVQMVTRARRKNLHLSYESIVQAATLRDLAKSAQQGDGSAGCVEGTSTLPPFSLLNTAGDGSSVRQEAATQLAGHDAQDVEDVLPCTPLQESLLALSIQDPSSYQFNETYQLPNMTDLARLESSWKHVVDTTPILRTRIVNIPSHGLVQVVMKQSHAKVLAPASTTEAPFALGSALWIAHICTRSNTFTLRMHHALFDGWTKSLLFEAVNNTYYEDAGPQKPLASFAPFVEHVLKISSSPKASEYWSKMFHGCEATPFPVPRSRQATEKLSQRHHVYDLQWPRHGPSVTAVLRTAISLLLGAYTNSSDVIFGGVMSGRQAPLPAVERIAGPMIATTPVRVEWDSNQTLISLQEQIEDQMAQSSCWQHVGLSQIHRTVDKLGRVGASKFELLLVVQFDDEPDEDGLRLFTKQSSSVEPALASSNAYGLLIVCTPTTSGLSIDANFDPSAIDPEQCTRMLYQLEHVFRQICRHETSQAPVSEVSLAPSPDLDLIQAWNPSSIAPVENCIHFIIEAHAHQWPNDVAVCAWDGDVSYERLNHVATVMAHYLIKRGVRRNSVVPICMDKSFWVPVSILAVLKAGGAFLLLDPTFPTTRLRSMLDRLRPAVLLGMKATTELCTGLVDDVCIVDEQSWDEAAAPSDLAPSQPSDLLYIVFTSGSTGTPKGCLITHENWASALAHSSNVVDINRGSRVYDFAPYSFDAAHWSMLHSLANGATLCIPSEDESRSGLSESLTRFRPTHLLVTPAVARLVDPSAVPTLRRLFLGGDRVEREDVARWMTESSADVIVAYGPAECSVATTYWKATRPLPRTLPIGRGCGVRTWIVNPQTHTKLAPVGSIGELCLEGPLVGAGYLGESEQTTAVFVQHTWIAGMSTPATRAYKTGDLVRFNIQNGTLEFVGRKDHQAKLRGQRLELAEVEHTVRECWRGLGQSPTTVAAEIITPKATGRQMLAIWVQQLRNDKGDSSFEDGLEGRLDRCVREKLPPYMCPAAYIPVSDLPLTSSGKIDRRRLREDGVQWKPKDGATSKSERSLVDSVSDLPQQSLRSMWAVVLRMDEADIHADSNFMGLGGDSISAMQLAATVRSRGMELSARDILKRPRLSDMAKMVENPASITTQKPAPPSHHTVEAFSLLKSPGEHASICREVAARLGVEEEKIEDVYPSTKMQKSVLAVTAKRAGDYVARYGLLLRKGVDVARLKNAWEQVSREVAPILRTRLLELPGEGIVQAQLDEPLPWTWAETEDEYVHSGRDKAVTITQPMTLLAIAGSETSGDDRVCVFMQHHAVNDGTSLWLSLCAVARIYAGVVETRPTAMFQTYIRHIMSSNTARDAEAFWNNELAQGESVPYPILPAPDFHPQADTTVRYELPATALWPMQQGFTASTVLRAAWTLLSAAYTDGTDVTFGALSTGRQAPVPDVERMVAPLIAAVPVRVRYDPRQTIHALLEQIQNQAIEMTAYEHVDLSTIRHVAADGTKSALQSHFNTLFVVQPATHGTDNMFREDGPFESWSKYRPNASGLDNSNAYAMMVVCHLTTLPQRDRHSAHGGLGVRLEVNFDARVVSKINVERLTEQFGHIFQQLCAPDGEVRSVGQIDCLSPQDAHELWTWNEHVPETVPACVHDLIGKNCSSRPSAPAVCSWDGDLTYAELDERATTLAHCLLAAGARGGDAVPLLFEKSKWMPVSAFAVMKAGVTSVAVDATQPAERLQSIVRQLGARFILCSAANEDLTRRISSGTVLVVDEKLFATGGVVCTQSLPPVSPLDPLYVVFTSGSTGTPKGIITTHQNFASAAKHQEEALRIVPDSRVLDFVSYAFDVAWSNLLQTLIVGACLCIPSETERRNDIPGAAARMHIDYVYFTPSVAQALEPASLPRLQTLAMGGEPISQAEVARWAPFAAGIISIYGPAECAQACCISLLSSDTVSGHVGGPVGSRIWLTKPGDPESLAPLGSVGELLIEGPLVASGYWGQPDLTATAFIDSPQWLAAGRRKQGNEQQAKIYKTGDLLRYDANGSLQYVGRKDTQVKLRGQRIELAEVEHHVREALGGPTVCQTVVAEVIKPQDSEVPILAAFVLWSSPVSSGPLVDSVEVRLSRSVDGLADQLAERLPVYMIPGAFIAVESLPTTVTNKIDRKALREMGSRRTKRDMANATTDGNALRPTTDVEKRLQRLWASILDIDPEDISADSSFLRIGGESISAMRLVAAARDEGLSFTVADIFRNGKLQELAKVAKVLPTNGEATVTNGEVQKVKYSSSSKSNGHQEFPLLEQFFLRDLLRDALEGVDASNIQDVYPATDFQALAIHGALQKPPDRVPHYIFDLPPDVDIARLHTACDRLVEHCSILRTVFVRLHGARLWQVVLKQAKSAFDYLEAQEDEDIDEVVSDVCSQDLKRRRPGLGQTNVRFMVVQQHCSSQHRLVFRLSHAQFDEIGFRTMLQGLSALYLGQDVPVESPFAGFVAHIERKRKSSLAYWKDRMKGAFTREQLNCGQAMADEQSIDAPGNRTMIETVLPLPQTSRLDEDISVATAFHAAAAIAISRTFKQDSVLFGRLVTGRAMLPPALLATPGPTLTELPIHETIAVNDNVLSVARRLQRQFIDDSLHEAAGMGELIQHCCPELMGTTPASTHWGWRTVFQQEETEQLENFMGSPSRVTFWDRPYPTRERPEVYATPRGGELVLVYAGNKRITDDDKAREVVECMAALLSNLSR